MRITHALPDDAGALGQIMAGWIAETSWMPKLHTADEDTWFLGKLIRENHVIVLRNRRGVHGFLARDGAMVHAFYLSPPARGKGWGRKMLNVAKSYAHPLRLWVFQQNTAARKFYAREGFIELERTDGAGNDEHLPDVQMIYAKGGP